MKSLLILPHIKVEGANAISGLVYGFPAVTHFLGYVHALSRELNSKLKIKLGGAGIICHNYQIHTYQSGAGGDYFFSLTRNPLTKEGDTAPFNEEGKICMEVSLVIECDFTSDDFDFDTSDDTKEFEKLVYDLAVVKRLAGGVITGMSPVEFHEIPQTEEEAQRRIRRTLFKMLPGFVLRDRSEIFKEYLSKNPNLGSFEAMLDFCTLKSKAIRLSENESSGSEKVTWEWVPKPCGGWIVPIQSGYKAISPLYDGGKVACARDPNVPFRFVEPVYGLGEWMGLHRIRDIEPIIWRYQSEKNYYICSNSINYKVEE